MENGRCFLGNRSGKRVGTNGLIGTLDNGAGDRGSRESFAWRATVVHKMAVLVGPAVDGATAKDVRNRAVGVDRATIGSQKG
jgi:hypothetical protein